MANATAKRIVLDGPRNAVVELTGILDTSNAGITPAIQKSDFTNNDVRMTLTGFRVDEIQYSITDQLVVNLFWNATADRLIAALAGRGKQCYQFAGGLQPVPADAGYDGNIDLTTTGWASGIQTYTLFIKLIKLYSV